MKSTDVGIKEESNIFYATPGSRAKKLFYYVTCTGHFYYQDTYSLVRDNYNSLLIMYILNGSAQIQCYGKSYYVKKDDVVLLNCFDPHAYKAIKDLETIWFHFDTQNGRELYENIYDVQGCVMESGNSYIIKQYIQRIYDMHKKGVIIEEALSSAYIARIIAEIFTMEHTESNQDNTSIEESVQYISQNYSKKLLVKELADQAALSQYYFSRQFKKETGFTPHEYITKTRITQAKILLKSTNKKLFEIAGLCGLSDEASLIKLFKRYSNMTPGQFRNTDF